MSKLIKQILLISCLLIPALVLAQDNPIKNESTSKPRPRMAVKNPEPKTAAKAHHEAQTAFDGAEVQAEEDHAVKIKEYEERLKRSEEDKEKLKIKLESADQENDRLERTLYEARAKAEGHASDYVRAQADSNLRLQKELEFRKEHLPHTQDDVASAKHKRNGMIAGLVLSSALALFTLVGIPILDATAVIGLSTGATAGIVAGGWVLGLGLFFLFLHLTARADRAANRAQNQLVIEEREIQDIETDLQN